MLCLGSDAEEREVGGEGKGIVSEFRFVQGGRRRRKTHRLEANAKSSVWYSSKVGQSRESMFQLQSQKRYEIQRHHHSEQIHIIHIFFREFRSQILKPMSLKINIYTII